MDDEQLIKEVVASVPNGRSLLITLGDWDGRVVNDIIPRLLNAVKDVVYLTTNKTIQWKPPTFIDQETLIYEAIVTNPDEPTFWKRFWNKIRSLFPCT